MQQAHPGVGLFHSICPGPAGPNRQILGVNLAITCRLSFSFILWEQRKKNPDFSKKWKTFCDRCGRSRESGELHLCVTRLLIVRICGGNTLLMQCKPKRLDYLGKHRKTSVCLFALLVECYSTIPIVQQISTTSWFSSHQSTIYISPTLGLITIVTRLLHRLSIWRDDSILACMATLPAKYYRLALGLLTIHLSACIDPSFHVLYQSP